ncbi:MAG: Mth938-like domain-containing protein [Candidatus Eremiobacterota bacterium]
MLIEPRGPVEHFLWGKFIICGKEHSSTVGAGKDIRLIGKKVTKWEERKGQCITASMITGVMDKNIDVLIIGIGVEGNIKFPEEVKNAIIEHGIKELIVEKTLNACKIYNKLFNEGKKVALLAHGTC